MVLNSKPWPHGQVYVNYIGIVKGKALNQADDATLRWLTACSKFAVANLCYLAPVGLSRARMSWGCLLRQAPLYFGDDC